MKRFKRPLIITCGNHKGGVGKTTIVVGLINFLLDYVDNILLIDMDPQLNLTKWVCSSRQDHGSITISEILRYAVQNDIDSEEVKAHILEMANSAAWDIYPRAKKKYSVIRSNLLLAKVKKELSSYGSAGEFKLVTALRHIASGYDLTIMDTPPSIETLAFDSVCASDYLMIPITPDGLAIGGAIDTEREVYAPIKRMFNPSLEILGIIVNEKTLTKLSRESVKEIENLWGDLVFNSNISRVQALGELPTRRETLKLPTEVTKDNATKTGINKTQEEFAELAREIITRLDRLEKERDKRRPLS